jgi:hypothetical protein
MKFQVPSSFQAKKRCSDLEELIKASDNKIKELENELANQRIVSTPERLVNIQLVGEIIAW